MRPRNESSGSTLLELMISMVVFALISGMVFVLFEMSHKGFGKITQRQNTHTQVAAVRAALHNDIQTTHFYGIGTMVNDPITVEGQSVSRSVMSAPTLDDWRADNNFDLTGSPQWNRWVIYRVTHQQEGELTRHIFAPEDEEYGRELLKPLPILDRLLNEPNRTRTSWPNHLQTQVLARSVKEFRVVLDQEAHSVSIHLSLTKPGRDSGSRPESSEAQFYIKPHNSAPID